VDRGDIHKSRSFSGSIDRVNVRDLFRAFFPWDKPPPPCHEVLTFIAHYALEGVDRFGGFHENQTDDSHQLNSSRFPVHDSNRF
jgi:hypothetical protein